MQLLANKPYPALGRGSNSSGQNVHPWTALSYKMLYLKLYFVETIFWKQGIFLSKFFTPFLTYSLGPVQCDRHTYSMAFPYLCVFGSPLTPSIPFFVRPFSSPSRLGFGSLVQVFLALLHTYSQHSVCVCVYVCVSANLYTIHIL